MIIKDKLTKLEGDSVAEIIQDEIEWLLDELDNYDETTDEDKIMSVQFRIVTLRNAKVKILYMTEM